MKRILLFLIVVSAVIFTGCESDDPGPVAPVSDADLILSFHPFYQGEDMQLNTRYNNVHDCTFEVVDLKFYLANIALHYDNGDTMQLSEIELIDFKSHKHTLEYPLSGGEFIGISFDIGVPVHLNGTQNPDFLTSVYSTDHPLSALNNTYWTWQSGYRFFMVDGRFDTIPDSPTVPVLFSFHTGRDELFRHAGLFHKHITGVAGAHNHLSFALDFENLFQTEHGEVNLRYERNFHGSPSQMELGARIADNAVEMFRLID